MSDADGTVLCKSRVSSKSAVFLFLSSDAAISQGHNEIPENLSNNSTSVGYLQIQVCESCGTRTAFLSLSKDPYEQKNRWST